MLTKSKFEFVGTSSEVHMKADLAAASNVFSLDNNEIESIKSLL